MGNRCLKWICCKPTFDISGTKKNEDTIKFCDEEKEFDPNLEERQHRNSSLITVNDQRPSISINITEDVFDKYEIEQEIGYGRLGLVRKAHSYSNENRIVAIKTIEKSKINPPSCLDEFKSQLSQLMTLDTTRMIVVLECFENERYFHIVSEYCCGGQLFDKIIEDGKYSELHASFIMKQILKSLKYLHSNGLYHGDLRLHKILFCSENSMDTKLIFFGYSKFNTDPQELKSAYDKLTFCIPPEIIRGEPYTMRSDMWSLGIILYMILSGDKPFRGYSREDIEKQILEDNLNMEGKKWAVVSEEAKELIGRLLEKNPDDRISAEEALDNQWVKDSENRGSLALDLDIIYEMNQLRRKLSLSENFYQQINDANIPNLNNLFKEIDQDRDGFLTWKEISAGIGIETFSTEEMDEIKIRLNNSPEEKIDYQEFLKVVIDCKFKMNEDVVWSAFKHFETDSAGYIRAANLQDAIEYAQDKMIGMPPLGNDSEHFENITYPIFKDILSKVQL